MIKRLVFSLALAVLAAGGARADVILGTSNLPGNPLTMAPGSVSGSMFLNVLSNNAPNDVMAAWNVSLKIVGDAGSTGTLTFQSPATGTPSSPANYVFGTNGLGISATNGGATLSANDFLDPNVGAGAVVPAGQGANLLQMNFSATANASGLFGIYAIEGAASTQWTDGGSKTVFFKNVPVGTGTVRIGEVLIQVQAVPEPSPLLLLGLAASSVAGIHRRRKKVS